MKAAFGKFLFSSQGDLWANRYTSTDFLSYNKWHLGQKFFPNFFLKCLHSKKLSIFPDSISAVCLQYSNVADVSYWILWNEPLSYLISRHLWFVNAFGLNIQRSHSWCKYIFGFFETIFASFSLLSIWIIRSYCSPNHVIFQDGIFILVLIF